MTTHVRAGSGATWWAVLSAIPCATWWVTLSAILVFVAPAGLLAQTETGAEIKPAAVHSTGGSGAGAGSARGAATVPEPTAPASGGEASLQESDRAKMTEAVLTEAAEAYSGGDYARAAALYQLVLERGVRNGHLYFNLGNAYQRQGQLGRAILAYRQAQLYLPRDGDVEANLSYARVRTRDRLEAADEGWARRIFFWYDRVSEFELFWATAGLNVLLWGLLALRWLRPAATLRWLALGSAAGVLLSGGTLAARAWNRTNTPEAVILGEEVSVRSGTDVSSVRLFLLHTGAEVRTRELTAGWIQIELPDGKRGWIERSQAGLVTP